MRMSVYGAAIGGPLNGPEFEQGAPAPCPPYGAASDALRAKLLLDFLS